MNKKRILALLLAAAVMLSLAGCGGISKKYLKDEFGLKTYYFGKDENLEDFPAPAEYLDPDAIYASLEYNEKMFYGRYVFDGEDEDFLKSADFITLDYTSEYDSEPRKNVVSSLPLEISAGPNFCAPARRNVDYNWANLTFLKEDGARQYAVCTYTVSGKEVTFTPLAQYQVQRDAEGKATGLFYELGATGLTYTFSFRGPEITLSNDSGSVTLRSYNFRSDSEMVYCSGVAEPYSPTVRNFDIMGFGISAYSAFDQSAYAYFQSNKDYDDEGYTYYSNPTAKYREDGLLTIAYTYSDEYGQEVRESRQFVAILGGIDSLILADGENVYYYTNSEDYALLDTVSQGMTEEERLLLEELEEAQLEALVQKKSDLFDDLAAAFTEAGISVQIDKTTGEIALDSTILFGVNESAVSQEGKALLSQFMQIYTSVVYSDTYNGFVSRILVEGHTDTTGTYELNQQLSQARADAVRDFCLSPESGVEADYQPLLAASLSAVGYSWDYPIYAADGTVDLDASRRVAFRFVVNLNQ